jgi:uncharacterized protein with HEPN domain
VKLDTGARTASKNPSQRLRDIVDNVDVIASFVAGMDCDEFASDQKTMKASMSI